jgi:hypothetical protein
MTPDPTLIEQVRNAVRAAGVPMLTFSDADTLARAVLTTLQGSAALPINDVGETGVRDNGNENVERSGPQGDASGRHTGSVGCRGAGEGRDDRTALRSGGEARRAHSVSDGGATNTVRQSELGSAALPSEATASVETMIERAQAAMAKLLLSATSVDRDVRNEADDAVKALIAYIEGPAWLRRPDYKEPGQ